MDQSFSKNILKKNNRKIKEVCRYLPSALEMAKKGTDSVWVLLLTGPLWPWWTGLCHATRGTPFRERTFPPRDSIRVFSDGTSGLWSAVRATAWSFFSLFNRPSAARESPTWAMYRVLPLRITTVAVVPDVLGSPCLVRGQESVHELVRSNRLRVLSLQVLTKLKLWQYWAIGLWIFANACQALRSFCNLEYQPKNLTGFTEGKRK